MAYWLMKSEPDVYGIDDLLRETTNMWEGCRNYTVRNYLRDEMRPGDLAFFYHSNSNPAGIVGTMEIISEPYPDPTQFDPSSEYYDPKSPSHNPRWFVRDVRFQCKFQRVVTLAEIKSHPVLGQMLVARKGQRLSIMPVTENEWQVVHELSGI